MNVRITEGQIAAIRAKMAKEQGGLCALCHKPFTAKDGPALDHDHTTGLVRAVLHRSCNGIEGRVLKLAQRAHAGLSARDYLVRLGQYYVIHDNPQTNLIHPEHLTDDQKREKANAARRVARAKKAGTASVGKPRARRVVSKV